MARRDLIVVGGSAGGIESLRALVRLLPGDMPAAVLVAVHIAPTAVSLLPSILGRAGRLRAKIAVDGDGIEPGTITVAPPDCHLMLHGDRIRLSRGPRESGHRPAVDPLFRSAARWFGPRSIAIVLSGNLDDGTAGAQAVKQRGGLVIAQDPDEAAFAGMPKSVIDHVPEAHVLPIAKMAELLVRTTQEEIADVPPERPTVGDSEAEDDDMAPTIDHGPSGHASSFTCPDCHGALWELHEGDSVRYRCRVGHAFAPESLVARQADHIEEALWTALRALEEAVEMSTRFGKRARERGLHALAAQYDKRVENAARQAATLRGLFERR